MDAWLKRSSRAEVGKGTASVHVLTGCGSSLEDEPHICGFFALSSHYVRGVDLSKTLANGLINVPATLLSRLGRSVDHQGFGPHLVLEALRVAVRSAALVGSRVVVLDAKNQSLARWYENSTSFRPLSSNPLRLVMKMSSAATAVQAAFDD